MVADLKAHPSADKAIMLGSWYAAHQQFDCAIETFHTGLQLDPNSAQLHYLTGIALLAQKRTPEAILELQRSAELQPNVIKPHYVLATIYQDIGDAAQAQAEWKKVLTLDPKSEPALEALSAALIERQDYPGVVQLLQKAPHTEHLSIRLAQALGLMNYLDEAATVLRDAIAQYPDSPALASALTVVLVKQVNYQQAIDLLQKTLEKHPENLQIRHDLFRLLVLTNHIDAAKNMGTELLRQQPKDAEVLYLNGVIRRSLGDYPGAKELLAQSIAINPNSPDARYNLGMVLAFLHEWQQAKEQLEKALDLGNPDPEVHYELAKALRGLGETKRASEEVAKYQDLKKSQETDLEARMSAARGDTALTKGNIDEAIKYYRDAIATRPDNALYHYKLALALEQREDTEGQKEQLEITTRLDPTLAAAQNALGYMLSQSGDVQDAAAHFRLAVQAAPTWTEAWINLAADLAMGARYAEAHSAIDKALELDPDNAEAKELKQQLERDPAARQ